MDDLVGRTAAAVHGSGGVAVLSAAAMNLDPLFLGLALLIALGGGLAVLGAWWTWGRDTASGWMATIVTAPPADLPPAVAAALVADGVVGREAIVATLADLSRRGVLHIALVGRGQSGRAHDVRVSVIDDQARLAPFERRLLNAVIGRDSSQVRLSSVRLSAVGDAVAAARSEVVWLVTDDLVRRGYLATRPSRARALLQVAGVVLMVVGILALWVASATLNDAAATAWGMPAGALLALGVLSFGVSQFMTWKTPAGVAAAVRWRGFARYMETIARLERPREPRELFERYLPYAIAFGIARSWTRAFAPDATAAPGPYGTAGSGDGVAVGGEGLGVPAPAVGAGAWALSDVQGWSDHAGLSLQDASGSLFDWFDTAGGAFASGGWDASGFGGDGGGGGGE